MDTPLISVILATYNGANFISEAIDSVLNQDYKNIELIIIDDASIDSTPQILEEYIKHDKRIRLFRNEKNLKLVNSLNKGISMSNGEYIARIDDDDIWCNKEKLTKQFEKLYNNPKLGIIGTFGNIIDEDGKLTWNIIKHKIDIQSVRRWFWFKNQLIHTSLLAKKDAIIQSWWYNEKWLYVEDFDLWLKILANGYEIENIAELMVNYRIRSGNTTAKKYHRMQWLTFLRLFHEKDIYPNIWIKIFNLFIRFLLILLPIRLIQFLKK